MVLASDISKVVKLAKLSNKAKLIFLTMDTKYEN